jgi:hypothetical protein
MVAFNACKIIIVFAYLFMYVLIVYVYTWIFAKICNGKSEKNMQKSDLSYHADPNSRTQVVSLGAVSFIAEPSFVTWNVCVVWYFQNILGCLENKTIVRSRSQVSRRKTSKTLLFLDDEIKPKIYFKTDYRKFPFIHMYMKYLNIKNA